MIITEAFYNDIPKIAKIEKMSFTNPWSEKSIRESFLSPCNHFFIAKDDDSILGYIGLSVAADEGYILNIAVNPRFRGRGIGKSLVNYVIDYTKDNLRFLTLEVRPSNAAAVELYTSLGFEKAGERKNYYTAPKENALLLTKHYTSKKE